MSLAALLTDYAELVGDAIANEAGQPVGRVLRYHGHAPAEDMDCTGNPLAVWWEGPSLASIDPGKCAGPLQVSLAAKWHTCFKIAAVKRNSTVLLWDAEWDATSGVLAAVAEVVARKLVPLACATKGDPGLNEYQEAMLEGARQIRFVGATPTGASGGVAGVIWRLTAHLIPQASVDPGPEPQQFSRTAGDSLGVDSA